MVRRKKGGGHRHILQKLSIVTTSWDDGHPLDLYLAEKLSNYSLKGTFYIPVHNLERPVMSPSEIRTLRDMGMEIGAHSVSHIPLTFLPETKIKQELEDGKKYLEDILGEKVSGFCYPRGKFSKSVRQLVRSTGYYFARTTAMFHVEIDDPYLMPTSIQLYKRSRKIYLRHFIKEFNWQGLWHWIINWKMEKDLLSLSYQILRYVLKRGGVFHLWGHSWEIEKLGLWSVLDTIFKLISEYISELTVLTNGETIDLLFSNR